MSDSITINEELVRQLKKVLAFAETGKVTNAVIVAMGSEIYHRIFSVPSPQDMPEMIGEVSLFKTEMELVVINNRGQQQAQRSAGIVGRPHLAS